MANLENIKRGQTVTEQINMINENVNNINDEVNDLVDNKAGYITSEDIPVTSVNNQTGNVSLQAKDVGAFPNSSTIQEFDLNNIKETGVYVGTYATNPYYLVVIKYNDTYIYQELIGSKFKEYRRFTGTWSEWVKEYSTENPVKASDIKGIETIDADKELNLALLEDTTFVKANIKYNPIAQRLYIGDKEFATIDYVDKAVNMIKSLIVTQLPDVGIANTIYFVPAGEESGNAFMEYIYVNGAWEIVGGTTVDLTPFLTIETAENTYAKISSLDSKVSKTTTINGKTLENNITLTAEDVGALSKDTQVSNDVVYRYTNSQIAEKLSAGEIVANDVILPIDDGTFLKGHIYLYDGTNLNEISNNVDLETDQSISGIKNFTGVLRYGGANVLTEDDIKDSAVFVVDTYTQYTFWGNNDLQNGIYILKAGGTVYYGYGANATSTDYSYNCGPGSVLIYSRNIDFEGSSGTVYFKLFIQSKSIVVGATSYSSSTSRSIAFADGTSQLNRILQVTTATNQNSNVKTEATWQTPPTPYNGTLTLQQNGTTLGTFSANQSNNVTYNIETPTDYVPTSRTVNGKSLSSDITLNATDVGAMPIDGTVTNVTFSLSGTTLTITPITEE